MDPPKQGTLTLGKSLISYTVRDLENETLEGVRGILAQQNGANFLGGTSNTDSTTEPHLGAFCISRAAIHSAMASLQTGLNPKP